VRYYLTDKGVRAANTFRSSVTAPADIPPAVLDPVVIAFRSLRAYGMEDYTEDDWEQIRSNLPDEYQDVPLPGLCKRALNRRKAGAYKEVKMLKCWVCGSIDDLEKVDTDAKKGMVFCESCRERNDPYFH
jgi:hypothetical protein